MTIGAGSDGSLFVLDLPNALSIAYLICRVSQEALRDELVKAGALDGQQLKVCVPHFTLLFLCSI